MPHFGYVAYELWVWGLAKAPALIGSGDQKVSAASATHFLHSPDIEFSKEEGGEG